ncbi:MAG: AAA family ATPase [Desulfovibrio sp.]|nr:AAA family ATPase [Desulfovibrio sp.]
MLSTEILIGAESFREIRENNYCYIDKTSFIEEMLSQIPPKVSLITRPRRFGKTLTMSMLQEFFDIKKSSKALFEGLSISKNNEICSKWMNKYPTVFITLKDIQSLRFDEAKELFQGYITRLYDDHTYLLDSSNVSTSDKKRIDNIVKGKLSFSDTVFSLFNLTHALESYWNKQIILLIDEYDSPIHYAQANGYYDEMINLLRSFFSQALKSNFSLKFAVITGCLRISKESMFSGLNNFKCYSISDEKFSDKIGFTKSDVEELMSSANLYDKKDVLKEWYDGYNFGNNTNIYCPWDVLMFVNDLQDNAMSKPKTYWKNTSNNDIIHTLVNKANTSTKEKIETLISGGTIAELLPEDLSYEHIYNNDSSIWSILYFTGYLTKATKQIDEELISLIIPNQEIKTIFKDTIYEWFIDTLDSEAINTFIQAIWHADAESLQKIMTKILYSTISYYDNAESYYHGFFTGLLRGAGLHPLSNREHGIGRPDIIIENKNSKTATIIEIKASKKYEDLENDTNKALQQIEVKKYDSTFSFKVDTIIKYGIAFWKKECSVKVTKKSI